jgi:hypothetical protein
LYVIFLDESLLLYPSCAHCQHLSPSIVISDCCCHIYLTHNSMCSAKSMFKFFFAIFFCSSALLRLQKKILLLSSHDDVYLCNLWEKNTFIGALSGNKKMPRGKLYGNSSVRNMCVCVYIDDGTKTIQKQF